MGGYRGEAEQSSAALAARTGSGTALPNGVPANRADHPAHAPAAGPLDGAPLSAPSANPAASPAPARSGAGRAQARRLIAVANDLLVLAAELEQSEAGPVAAPAQVPGDGLPEDERRWLRQARLVYRRRRSRALFFEESLFGEPAWDLLLDLFIAAKERKRVPVTSACIGAAVPTTTALRWLAILEERGLILREADPTDARRVFVRLSADAYGKMVAYFARSGVDRDDSTDSLRSGD